MGRRTYRTRCDCQFARHINHPHESFSVSGCERRKCPSASAETSVRRERPVKEEEEKKEFEEGSKEDGDKAPAARRRKVPKSQYNVLHLHAHEDNLPLWLR